eukprot:1494185-Pyramimonas_sp.AAC.1
MDVCLLGPFCRGLLEASWRPLGPSWGHLGRLGAVFGRLGARLDRLGGLLGLSWPILDATRCGGAQRARDKPRNISEFLHAS